MCGARRRIPTRTLVGFALLTVVLSCQDSPPTSPADPGAQFDISEARQGGNPDFFFAAPLASTPQPGDENFDEGRANGALVPYVRVCVTDETPTPAGCTTDVTEAVTGSISGLSMTFDAGAELYQVNWKTDRLVEGTVYRVEIWGLELTDESQKAEVDGRWLFGWRDIANAPSTASCSDDTEVCLINFGQTIPVKVRIEDFVFCPESRNCAVQFVASGIEANLEALLDDPIASSAQLLIPGQAGTDFALAFEPCSGAEETAVDAALDLPTFGPCVKTETPPREIVLTDPVVISLCTIDEAGMNEVRAQLADEASLEELKLHHFSTEGVPGGPITSVEAWPEVAAACGDPTSGGLARAEPDDLFGHALALAERALSLSLFRPRRLAALDEGGGGEGLGVFSFYKLALPAKFEYEADGDDFRAVPVGSDVTLRAKVTDLEGRPVRDARVRWSVLASPGGDATVSTSPVLSGPDGISETTVTLSATEGDNLFHASGKGIADDRESGCTLPGGTAGDASCNGPRSTFDPFQPNTFALDGGIEVVPDGTRLPFTVFGCEPGRGTATVDGILSAGEWQCANSATFPANLSGGSTVDATLLWMNDDTGLHFAVSVPGAERKNALRFEFDSDGDGVPGGSNEGVRELLDDVWEFTPDKDGGGSAVDRFIDEKCSESNQSGCGVSDADFGGGNQTVAAFDNTRDGVTVYEISHPLATGDVCDLDGKNGCGAGFGGLVDLDASRGETVGMFLTLSMGSGAQGNTQWPGFLHYLPIQIR